MVEVEGILVFPSALKHPGITEADIGHRAKWRIQFVVFHAMEARDKFLTPKERSEVRRR